MAGRWNWDLSSKSRMHNSEFRTLCHSLGLSAKALAALARVQERSVRHWWSDWQPPAWVVKLVQLWAYRAGTDESWREGGDQL